MSRAANSQLQHEVMAELEFDPSVDATKLGVLAEDGVITLTGHVPTFSDKWNAERVVKRVVGVRAVANEIDVRLPATAAIDDESIARSAANALSWNATVPRDKITVSVTNAWVTLEGTVEWQFQKKAAEDAVRVLAGVRGVSNNVSVVPKALATDVKAKIEAALKRNAEIDARKINVNAAGGTVTLTGDVRSWIEREDAVNAAWSAAGVKNVLDEIRIRA
ncbi:MAG TPA: BON domain-containing protein [Thermoanaerobaculia bacterium]|nr:BON domain-containing protein [Thermoanaerobaculia bacterium]